MWKFLSIKKFLIIILLKIPLLFFCLNCSSPPEYNQVKKKTFRELNSIKNHYQKKLIKYFSKINQKAEKAAEDKKLLKFFFNFRRYYSHKRLPENCNSVKSLEYKLDKYFISVYNNFYDILFLNSKGFVFHSVKQESDYHHNIFKCCLSNSLLSKKLEQNKGAKQQFVDYDYYLPSGEAAAFFTIPIQNNDTFSGYIILQCPINKINLIMTEHRKLKQTGEVYLVNHKKYMLTDSRFSSDSTILKKKIYTRAVQKAFIKKKGQALIKDYRGVNVFSVYEQLNCFGNKWVIIVEIDEEEILTKQYLKHKSYYQKKIYNFLAAESSRCRLNNRTRLNKNGFRADMNEVIKSEKEFIFTQGVGPCTAISLHSPKKISWLAHIKPTDKVYLHNPLTRLFLSEENSDLLDDLLQKISWYDLTPAEMTKIKAHIAATHLESFESILERLLKYKIGLNHIKFFYNPVADYLNIQCRPGKKYTLVSWQYADYNRAKIQQSTNLPSIGSIIKKVMKDKI